VLLFGAVQATSNLLELSVGPALAEAHARGLRLIVKEALANGRLTARGDIAGLRSRAPVRSGPTRSRWFLRWRSRSSTWC
jgi:hypothetical protein